MDEKKTSVQLAKAWDAAREAVEAAQTNLNRARTRLANAEIEFGRHLNPGDMKQGETICLWVRFEHEDERLIECRLNSKPANFDVAERGHLPPPPNTAPDPA